MPYLPVSDGHRLFYEVCGNPCARRAILVLHGGPGSGCTPIHKTLFDLKKCRVILFDQRGAGRSLPFASTHANTTAHLLRDIDSLLDHLGETKVHLCGGSWGSTLALAYAIHNPKRVDRMVIWGIFLASESENTHYLKGGVRPFFPAVWDRFVSHVPSSHRKNPAPYYFKQMRSKNARTRHKYAYEWSLYEFSIATLDYDPKQVRQALGQASFVSISTLEGHYLLKGCYLPPGHILKNTARIAHIPTAIIQGRYDMVCPPHTAQALHSQLKRSTLLLPAAGHSAREMCLREPIMAEISRLLTPR